MFGCCQRPGVGHTLAVTLLLSCSAVAVHAQSTPGSSTFQNQFPDPLQYEPPAIPPPELQLNRVQEISIEGPIIGAPRWFPERVEITTDRAVISLDLRSETPEIATMEVASPPPSETEFGVSPSGNHRARVQPGKRLFMERRCANCVPTRWRRMWKLRTAGIADTAPLVDDRRLYFGSQDNRVFGLRRRNGHRLWATDVGGRMLRRLASWKAEQTDPRVRPVAAILAVPEPGAEMVVLDAAGGRQVLTFKLSGEEDRILGPVHTGSDGRIWLLRQGYRPSDLSLIEITLTEIRSAPSPKDDSSKKGYNSAVSTPDTNAATPRPVETPPDGSL